MAIEKAGEYLGGICGISGSSQPYPIDDNGEEITDYATLKGRELTYQHDFYVNKSLWEYSCLLGVVIICKSNI